MSEIRSRTAAGVPKKREPRAGAPPDHEIIIIGTGFSGLGMAIQLRRAGMEGFVLLEKEADVGGTWLVNDYPGCACDVQSHLYSFSFEPNPDWSREFSPQPEILSYIRRCAEKYGLGADIRFNTWVIGATYDEKEALWRVCVTDAKEMGAFLDKKGIKPGEPFPLDDPGMPPTRVISARVVISGMGGLSTPAYPNLPGLDAFQGKTFHSQKWDHAYDLNGKRVAVIGTGASAIQFVPEIQPKVSHLDLYQRTPPWVLPKPDRKITDRERSWFNRVPGARWLRRTRLYWTLESRAIAFVVKPELLRVPEKWGRELLAHQVLDETLRAKLTPNYSAGCKRILLSWNYYPAITQPNVSLVTSGIREVRANSIVDTEGVERPVDAIIFGTGFRIASEMMPRGLVKGRGGLDLATASPNGPEAYKGTTVAGFPNLFLLVGPNTGLGHNSLLFMIEAQITYVLDALRMMRKERLCSIEVKREAQDAFNEKLQEQSKRTVWTTGGCKSYYIHPETGRNLAVWPNFTFLFRFITRKFDRESYSLERATPPDYAAPRPETPKVAVSTQG
jgi:cation diffusion facilitator CzcD-associated flavoprotein CzcO